MRQQARALLAWKRAHSSILLAEADPGHALDQAYEVATEQSDHELRSVLHSVLWTNWQTYEIPAVNPLNAASSKTTPPVLLADGATIAFATGLGELVLMGLADGRLRGAFAGAHSTQATAAALSRDGETLLTADFGGVVSLWDTRALLEGSLLGKSWSEDPRFVTCAAAAAGADVFFVGGVEGRLERFALGSDGTYDATATPIPGCDDLTVQDLWPQPGGRILLAHVQRGVGNSQTERSLCLFDSVRGDVLLRVTFPASLGLRAEWSPRGDRFAFCEQEGALGLFDAEGHSLWQVDEQSTLNSVRFAPGGTQLLSFGFRGLTVWDADTGGEGKRQSSATGRSFEDGWLSPDGALLAVAIRDSTIRLFETGEWNEIAYLSHSVTGYGVHGLWGRDGRLAVFDHTSIQGFAPPFRPYLPRLGEGQGARVVSLAFDPDGELLASATEDNSVRIWDLGSGRVRREVPCLQAPLRVRASSEQLLVVTKEPVARLWPWSPAGEPIELRGHEAPVTDGWFLAEGEEVLTIAADSCARLWSAGDGRPLREFPMEAGPLHTAAFDEAADLLAVGGEEPAVHVFELSTGRHLRRLTGPAEGPLVFVGRPTYLHFDAVNHRLYAAAQGSGGVACWDIAHDFAYSMLGGMSAGSTGWALTDTEGRWLVCSESVLGFTRWFDAATHAKLAWDPAWEPGTMINRMQFSGDGRRLLLASYDGTVRLFDMARLEPWSILRSDHGGAMDACFSPDGERVAVGYKDGALLVWPFDPLPVAREHLVRRVER